MGHANFTNISTVINRMLKRKEGTTIRECVDILEKKKQTVHASEGEYEDRYMLSDACSEIVNILEKEDCITFVAPLNKRQLKIYRQWKRHDVMDWDGGDDEEGGEYAIFDSIRWVALKKKLPIVRYFTR